jgi:hypothetical protein
MVGAFIRLINMIYFPICGFTWLVLDTKVDSSVHYG